MVPYSVILLKLWSCLLQVTPASQSNLNHTIIFLVNLLWKASVTILNAHELQQHAAPETEESHLQST